MGQPVSIARPHNSHIECTRGSSEWWECPWPVSAEFHKAHKWKKKYECVPILDFDDLDGEQLPSIKSIYLNDRRRDGRSIGLPETC